MKERIIGAAVLVVFVVLVVPIFLDGPPEEGEIVSERVLLPGQEEQKTQTVVLDRDRTDPVPTASAPAPERSESPVEEPATRQAEPPPEPAEQAVADEPALAQEPVASEPEPTERPAAGEPAPASTTGMWAVQLGSFSNKDNADKLAADLRKQGYSAFIRELRTNSGAMHRVRIGPQKDRESAEAMAARLARVGHEGKVVPHP